MDMTFLFDMQLMKNNKNILVQLRYQFISYYIMNSAVFFYWNSNFKLLISTGREISANLMGVDWNTTCPITFILSTDAHRPRHWKTWGRCLLVEGEVVQMGVPHKESFIYVYIYSTDCVAQFPSVSCWLFDWIEGHLFRSLHYYWFQGRFLFSD